MDSCLVFRKSHSFWKGQDAPFGTHRAYFVMNKSQCLKETRINQVDISDNKKREATK